MKKSLLFKFLFAFSLSILSIGWLNAQVFITELADPNNNAGLRYIELFNAGSTAVDFTEGSGWRIDKYTNASATVSQTLALTGTIPANGFYIIATGVADTDFEAAYGVAPDQFDGADNNVAGSNGDDNLELYNGSNTLVDQFGVPGEDGSGTNHEFEDGRAERVATVITGNPTWNVAEWNIDNDSGGGDGTQAAPWDFDIKDWIGVPDLDPPVWTTGYPNAINVVDNKGTLVVNMDEPGIAYYIVVFAGSTAPTADQVKAGVDYDTVHVLPTGNIIVEAANTDYFEVIEGASPEVSYDIWVVAEDGSLNLQSAPAMVNITTTPARTLSFVKPQDKDSYYLGDAITFEWTSTNIDSILIGAYIYEE
ncbi:MAG: lamin tail domain-containing protein, partial [Bacteroidota bacterium]|nr:lamin tail domain-containing protein [Bacteroidota bacterium]